MGKDRPRFEKKDFVRHNEQIRIPQVLLIYEGRNMGVMSNHEALAKARAVGLDLVEVAPHARPPVCSIMDYGKYMFDRQKKLKVKSSVKKEKEVAFRYVIDEHDLETKANQVRRFLEKDFRVKLVVKFKQREKAHKDQGFVIMQKLLNMIDDVAAAEKPPMFEGTNIIVRVDAKKGKKDGLQGDTERAGRNPGSTLPEPEAGRGPSFNRNAAGSSTG